MKKLLILLSLLALCVFAVSCSCEDEEANGIIDPASCEHYWDNGKITKEATVTATGKMTYTCVLCKSTREEATPKKPHDHLYNTELWNSDRMNHWHDCVVDGCTVKGGKGAHQWDEGEIIVESNPVTTGKKLFTCTECSYAKEEEYRAVATVTKEEFSEAIKIKSFENVTVQLNKNGSFTETMKIADGYVQYDDEDKIEEGQSTVLDELSHFFSQIEYEKFSYDEETRVYFYTEGSATVSLQFADGNLYSFFYRRPDGKDTLKLVFTNYGRTVIEQ